MGGAELSCEPWGGSSRAGLRRKGGGGYKEEGVRGSKGRGNLCSMGKREVVDRGGGGRCRGRGGRVYQQGWSIGVGYRGRGGEGAGRRRQEEGL